MIESLILGVYTLSMAVLFVYGCHGFLMVYHFRRRRPAAPPAEWSETPCVTVQLPVYNERYVVAGLLDACLALEYPRDRLEIQVLDDSTDDTTTVIRSYLAAVDTRGGVPVHHICRGARAGFKAGALRHGLATARGDYIVVFDADFRPRPDFLRHTLPPFADPRIGMVQTRWTHRNRDYSLLTRVQALGLDGHFVVEQTARHQAGFFLNFNGTAGVWRKACILDAGNWQDDTLTEDLDLSYRAQLRGWRFVYLPDVETPAELPVDLNAMKSQQFRWTKGAIETSKKLLPQVWRAALPLRVKLEATVHLTSSYVFPLILLVGMLNLPVLWIKTHGQPVQQVFVALAFFTVAFLGSLALYGASQRAVYPDWKRRLILFPLFMAVSMGVSLNNTRAVIEGLLNRKSPFVRTPKFHVVRPGDSWQQKSYRAPRNPLVGFECALALYFALVVVVAVVHTQFMIAPFLVMFAAGYAAVSLYSLKHGSVRVQSHPARQG